MIKDEKVALLCRQWAMFTPAQKEEVKARAERMRSIAIFGEPFSNPGLESFRVDSEVISEMTAENFKDGDGVAPAIEIAMLEELQSPTVLAWEYAYRHLQRALQDDAIGENPVVVLMLENALITAGDAAGYTSSDDLYSWIGHQTTHREIAKRAAEAAASKNSQPRAWVFTEWSRRLDRDQGKAAFARQYVPLVKKKFNLKVTPETIARDWIPKARK